MRAKMTGRRNVQIVAGMAVGRRQVCTQGLTPEWFQLPKRLRAEADLTGLGGGGNKTRKLQITLGVAIPVIPRGSILRASS
jgi:hypothetical protein